MASATTFYDFKPLDKKGDPFETSSLKGKVVLVVNTASACGFTPQLRELQELYTAIKDSPQGSDFEILGTPCNQFGGQNPENDDDTQTFCSVNYGVTFPILGKTDVNGKNADPMWEWMKSQKKSLFISTVKWNFEKFLIGKDGKVKERWASTTKPLSLKNSIEKELKA